MCHMQRDDKVNGASHESPQYQVAWTLFCLVGGEAFSGGLQFSCVVCRLPEHIVIQKFQWCPHGPRFC